MLTHYRTSIVLPANVVFIVIFPALPRPIKHPIWIISGLTSFKQNAWKQKFFTATSVTLS